MVPRFTPQTVLFGSGRLPKLKTRLGGLFYAGSMCLGISLGYVRENSFMMT